MSLINKISFLLFLIIFPFLLYAENINLPKQKLLPQIRQYPLENEGLKLSKEIINHYLTRYNLLQKENYENQPAIVAIEDKRVIAAKGDIIYVKNYPSTLGSLAQVVKIANPIKIKDKIVAYELEGKGLTRLISLGEISKFVIENFTKEIEIQDKLAPISELAQEDILLKPLNQEIKAEIISIFGGLTNAGFGNVVVINAGNNQGLKKGNLLSIYKPKTEVKNKDFPPILAGKLAILATTSELSMALITSSVREIDLHDLVVN